MCKSFAMLFVVATCITVDKDIGDVILERLKLPDSNERLIREKPLSLFYLPQPSAMETP